MVWNGPRVTLSRDGCFTAADIEQTAALPCWLDVDLDAIAENVRALQSWVSPRTRMAAVVKAQGYGAGAERVARAALGAGATWLAVARVHEGFELREAGLDAPILVLNRTDPAEADLAVRAGLAVTVDGEEVVRALGVAAARHGRRAAVHLKVDTGLHRFGVEPERALPLARYLASIEGVDVQALYTHFASADEPDSSFTREQLARFQRVTEDLADAGYRFPILHAANSAATLGVPEAHLDLVRLGLTLYGTSPSGLMPEGLQLRPAVALRARVARVMELSVGEGVGYGQTWRAQRPTRLALVSAGYADGVSRRLSNRGRALIQGREVPLVGRVSMDMTTIDITAVPGVDVGAVVTFFGRDGSAEVSLSQFAAAAETIPHEAMTLIGGRVARVYWQRGEVSGVSRLGSAVAVAPGEARAELAGVWV